MAVAIKEATGNAVKTWCFVEGARANRVFYVYELPELEALEAQGPSRISFLHHQAATPMLPAASPGMFSDRCRFQRGACLGRVKEILVPFFGSLSIQSLPPWSLTISLER